MTLSERNMVFKTGMVITFLSLLVCIAASILIIPLYENMGTEITHYSNSIFRTFTGNLMKPNLLAAHVCIMALVLFSFLSIIFIYYFFEKTQSGEILFIYFFSASFTFEILRLILPIVQVYEIPSMYLLGTFRVIFFGRYFGIFSLFAASVFAVGYKSQGLRYLIIIILVVTLIISFGIPVDTDTGKLDSSLNMIKGYTSLISLIEMGTFLITTVSFFIAVWIRSNREFIFVGIGSVLVFLGRAILFSADNWLGPPLGLVCLAAGFWLICTNLHKIYLWN